jgi:transposase
MVEQDMPGSGGRFQPGQSGNPSGRFQKGQSGNPSGRPKRDREIEALAREHTDIAIRTLVEICGNPKATPSARVTAAGILLDRGWGKWKIEIVRRCDRHRFVVLSKRWIVERTIGWISRNRRLARDFERHCRIAAAFVRMAMIRLMLRRLAAKPSV